MRRITIKYFDSLQSTNLTAKKLALEGAAHGTVVTADTQTAGKGRMGRTFFSPAGGIYMSVILRPSAGLKENNIITMSGAAAVCRSIEKLYRIKPDIKGFNDVMIDNRKVCGILTETMIDPEGGTGYIIIGIGINFKPVAFPEEIRDTAGTLPERADISRNRLITEIVNNILADINNYVI